MSMLRNILENPIAMFMAGSALLGIYQFHHSRNAERRAANRPLKPFLHDAVLLCLLLGTAALAFRFLGSLGGASGTGGASAGSAATVGNGIGVVVAGACAALWSRREYTPPFGWARLRLALRERRRHEPLPDDLDPDEILARVASRNRRLDVAYAVALGLLLGGGFLLVQHLRGRGLDAAAVADRIQQEMRLPLALADGFQLSAVEANGDLVVFTIRRPGHADESLYSFSQDALEALGRQEACELVHVPRDRAVDLHVKPFRRIVDSRGQLAYTRLDASFCPPGGPAPLH